MNEREEVAYVLGSNVAWRTILGEALRRLGIDDPEARCLQWIAGRLDAVVSLRRLCAEFGDNEWPDDADLSDVIENHLGDHLRR